MFFKIAHIILKEGIFLSKEIINKEDIFTILIGAMIHDLNYSCFSNSYLYKFLE